LEYGIVEGEKLITEEVKNLGSTESMDLFD
jgi:hypothetical protein